MIVGIIIWPIKTLFADILLMQTPVRDHSWFKTVKRHIYAQITNILNFTKDNVDSIFAFTIDN
jgi:hypothetical protein